MTRKLRSRRLRIAASEGKYLFQEPASGKKLRQGLAVIIAGEPVFTTVGGMDFRIVPLQVVHSGLQAAAG
ncbi:MAG TPA: hypothetical protein VFW54_04075 [Propionibacteriaceae bacterium]|nr:hypothetical protein [Propionibacteriaceae bacterium]